jgi:glucose dehydrogenase
MMALNGYAFIGGIALLVALFLLYRRSPKLSGIFAAVTTITLLLWNIAAWVWEV